jgi:hypothetical protein
MTHATRLRPTTLPCAVLVAALAASSCLPAWAAEPTLEAMNDAVNQQVRRLAELRKALEREEAALAETRRALARELLNRQNPQATAAQGMQGAQPPVPAQGGQRVQTAQAAEATRPTPVGEAPSPSSRPPAAPIFEEPSVLTRKGGFVLEPSVQYGYASNNRVTLLGYTIIPALLIGLIDVREVKRNTVTAALTGRLGVANGIELEARVPYVWRSDSTRSREIATGTAVDTVVGARGQQIGDVEVAARYQLRTGSSGGPFMIGMLRYKSRTGRDPFEVVTDCEQRCVGNTTGTGQPLTLPTGSGFQSVQAGLTWLLPSDPAVLFGSFTYLHNIARNNVERTVLNGERESLGRIAPGGVFGFNVGIGLALNDKSSFSLGYDHNSVAATKQNGVTVPGSLRTQLGTLLVGYSHRLDDRRSLNVSLGAGLTQDAPDLSLTVRMPFSF